MTTRKSCVDIDCVQCDLGVILKDFIKPIIQLLTNDIREYAMENRTTKCLNTAVMLMYFMLGQEGISTADACDCTTFNEKSKRHITQTRDYSQNSTMVKKLKNDVLKPRTKGSPIRELYYILLTDATFNITATQQVYFPGHVMIIEKVHASPTRIYYNLYQSYVNQYDLKGYYEYNGNTFQLTRHQIRKFMNDLVFVMNAPKWTKSVVDCWRNLTSIDTSYLLGAACGNQFFICWKKVEPKYCLKNIQEYAEMKLKILQQKSSNANSLPYGDSNLYATDSYLTNGQMRAELERLILAINSHL